MSFLRRPDQLPYPKSVARMLSPGDSSGDNRKIISRVQIHGVLNPLPECCLPVTIPVTIGSESIGSESIGSESAGSESIGSEAIGSESIGSESIGSEPIGS